MLNLYSLFPFENKQMIYSDRTVFIIFHYNRYLVSHKSSHLLLREIYGLVHLILHFKVLLRFMDAASFHRRSFAFHQNTSLFGIDNFDYSITYLVT